MKNQVRAFLAVDLSPEVRGSIQRLIRSVRQSSDCVKWVETQNLHITLKFLGDVPMNDLPKIADAMKTAASKTKPFVLGLQGLGAFPNSLAPKTIWIGCGEGNEALSQLAGGVEAEMEKLGYPKENRRFSPHLTIGRVKQSEASTDFFAELLEARKAESFGSCAIGEIILYSSELTSRGPIYTQLASAGLGS